MIQFALTVAFDGKRVEKAADEASFRTIGHAASAIRKDAIASIVPGQGASPPGSPPHTHSQRITKKGKVRQGNYQRAIVFDVSKIDAVIGPRASVVGQSFAAHEFGGDYFGESYPARPTMGPALDRNASRFGDSFAGSIGE